MANFNKVMLMGNLTRDPLIKYLPSGTPVAEFGLAINRSWNDQASGEKRESTVFVDCRSMGKQAEVIGQYCNKGKPLFIEGRLEYRTWEAKDGTKRSKLDVFVEGFQFIGGRREDAEGRGGGGPGYAGAGAPAQARDAARTTSSSLADDAAGPEMSFGTGTGYSDAGEDDVPF